MYERKEIIMNEKKAKYLKNYFNKKKIKKMVAKIELEKEEERVQEQKQEY